MALSDQALLSPDLRERLAADPQLGGGNVLASALAVNPNPDVPFIHAARPLAYPDGELQDDFSLSQLDHLAQSWSVWYLEQGVQPRDRVAIYIQDCFAYSVHFYALSQIGAIPVLINSKSPGEIAAALCRRTAPVGIYTDQDRMQGLAGELDTFAGLRWTATMDELPAPPSGRLPDEARFRHAPDDPVAILHSSGTTGVPKSAIHTHSTLVAGPKFRLVNFTESPDALMLAAQPQSHVGCIGYGTYAVLAGTPIVELYDPNGEQLAEAVAKYRPTMVLAFGGVYTDLAAYKLPEQGALDSVIGWVSMADAVHAAHIRTILGMRSAHLPEPAVFYDRFGSTELGWGLMVEPRTLQSERSDRRVGTPDPLAEAVVLRKDGTRADVGEPGLLGIKSPSLTAGYWDDSDLTYRSRLSGYWLSGDVVYRDQDGCFYHLDRAVDMVETTAGTGYSVLMEELLLGEVSGIMDCAVVLGIWHDERVPVAVVKPRAFPADPEELLAKANAALRTAGYPELAVLDIATSEEDMPLGATGKVLKRKLREKYGSLETYVAAKERTAIATRVGERAEATI